MTADALEVHFAVEPSVELDVLTDHVMEALLQETALVDPDLGVNLRDRVVDVAMIVEGTDQPTALSVGLTGLRSAMARAGYDVHLDRAPATVRPPEAG